ncbi:MAG: hypothetical protein WA906_09970 [Pacificimonas sp.]
MRKSAILLCVSLVFLASNASAEGVAKYDEAKRCVSAGLVNVILFEVNKASKNPSANPQLFAGGVPEGWPAEIVKHYLKVMGAEGARVGNTTEATLADFDELRANLGRELRAMNDDELAARWLEDMEAGLECREAI